MSKTILRDGPYMYFLICLITLYWEEIPRSCTQKMECSNLQEITINVPVL